MFFLTLTIFAMAFNATRFINYFAAFWVEGVPMLWYLLLWLWARWPLWSPERLF